MTNKEAFLRFFPKEQLSSREMANGMRMYGEAPLSENEIREVRQAIKAIEADENVFVFNDPGIKRTCYVAEVDKVYIGRNVFPETRYGSTHPRDLMSVRAVLAHEYYGHRYYREEYLEDPYKTPKGEDECRASLTAAEISPGLTRLDRAYLIQDAFKRAEEFGTYIEHTDFTKEVLYGENYDVREIAEPTAIHFVGISSIEGDE